MENDSGGEDKTSGMPISYYQRLLMQLELVWLVMIKMFIKTLEDTNLSQPYQERSLKQKFDNISLKCKSSGITDALIEFTQTIYNGQKTGRKYKTQTKRGDSDQGLQAASLFYAFQEDGHPKTYKEIARVLRLNLLCFGRSSF